MKRSKTKPEVLARNPYRDREYFETSSQLVRHVEFIRAVAELLTQSLSTSFESEAGIFWKMASEQDIESMESDSPFFPSSSIIPQTILDDLCRWACISIFVSFISCSCSHWIFFPPYLVDFWLTSRKKKGRTSFDCVFRSKQHTGFTLTSTDRNNQNSRPVALKTSPKSISFPKYGNLKCNHMILKLTSGFSAVGFEETAVVQVKSCRNQPDLQSVQ